jgi:hypothetical protein
MASISITRFRAAPCARSEIRAVTEFQFANELNFRQLGKEFEGHNKFERLRALQAFAERASFPNFR